LAAIGVTALFVAVVLTDIVIKGLPAFTQHQLVLPVKIDAVEIDPNGTRDPAVIRAGDFQLLVRNALRAEFPTVSGRAERRALDGLLSSGAADALRGRVAADPALVGQSVTVPVLLSDDADLYLKGTGTRIDRVRGRGVATVSGTGGEVSLQSSADDFAALTADVKNFLSARARVERQEAERFKHVAAQANAKKAGLEKSLAGWH
jgi:phosphate transport system permease protein